MPTWLGAFLHFSGKRRFLNLVEWWHRRVLRWKERQPQRPFLTSLIRCPDVSVATFSWYYLREKLHARAVFLCKTSTENGESNWCGNLVLDEDSVCSAEAKLLRQSYTDYWPQFSYDMRPALLHALISNSDVLSLRFQANSFDELESSFCRN